MRTTCETTYTRARLRSGLKDGRQNHREISISTSIVTYGLERVTKKVTLHEEDEETGRVYSRDVIVETRPEMIVTTQVVRSKNRFGLVRLYGTQGLQKPVATVLK